MVLLCGVLPRAQTVRASGLILKTPRLKSMASSAFLQTLRRQKQKLGEFCCRAFSRYFENRTFFLNLRRYLLFENKSSTCKLPKLGILHDFKKISILKGASRLFTAPGETHIIPVLM